MSLRRSSKVRRMVSTESCGPVSAASAACWVGAFTQELQLIASRVACGASSAGQTPVADAPAGHGIGLAPAVEHDHPVADRRIVEQRDMLAALVEQAAVDLVAHDGDVGMGLQPLGQAVEGFSGDDASRRVGRAVEHEEPGARRDLGQHLVGIEGESGLLVERDRNRRRAGEPDRGLVDGEARIGVEDLGPRLAEHQRGEEHRDLAARHHHDIAGIDLDTPVRGDVRRHRLAQRRGCRWAGV